MRQAIGLALIYIVGFGGAWWYNDWCIRKSWERHRARMDFLDKHPFGTRE